MEHEDTKIRSFSFSLNNLPFFVSSCLVKIIPTYLFTITKVSFQIVEKRPIPGYAF